MSSLTGFAAGFVVDLLLHVISALISCLCLCFRFCCLFGYHGFFFFFSEGLSWIFSEGEKRKKEG